MFLNWNLRQKTQPTVLFRTWKHKTVWRIGVELYTEMTQDTRGIVFIWVPSHVGIKGNGMNSWKIHISSFKRVYCLSSDKEKRRIFDSLIALWPFFCYSFLFIEGWGTTSVHRMWRTFNCWTYFTYSFRSYWNNRETAQSLHVLLFEEISLEKIFNLLKEISIYWKS